MEESWYPTIEIETMNQFVIATGKLEKSGLEITEDTVIYYLAGPQVKHKRTMKIRIEKPGQFSFIQAMAIAIRLKFVPKMVDWYEINRNWKDGAYIYRPKPK